MVVSYQRPTSSSISVTKAAIGDHRTAPVSCANGCPEFLDYRHDPVV
jgi:hypothetical protein